MSRKPPPDDAPPQPMEGKVYGRDEKTPAETEKHPAGSYSMPIVPQPPSEDGGFWPSVVTGFKNRTEKRLATGYQHAFAAYERMINAASAVGDAIMHHQRVASELQDIDKVLEADQLARDDERMEAKMHHMDVEMTYDKKKAEYDRFKSGAPSNDDLGDLSREEEEFKTGLRAKLTKRSRKIIEQLEKEFIRDCGGEDNMTDADREELKRLRREGEQQIKDQQPP